MSREDELERLSRFQRGAADAVKKGCGGAEVVQIAGGPWVACPGCADCDETIARLRKLSKEIREEHGDVDADSTR